MSNSAWKLASTFCSPTPLKYINRDRPREKNAAESWRTGSVRRPMRAVWIQKNEIRALAINLNQRVHLFSRAQIDRRGMRMERRRTDAVNEKWPADSTRSHELITSTWNFTLNSSGRSQCTPLFSCFKTQGRTLLNSKLLAAAQRFCFLQKSDTAPTYHCIP